MARNKHSAALFEVIKSESSPSRATRERTPVRLPNWWFPGLRRSEAKPEPKVPVDTAVGSSQDSAPRELNIRLSYPAAALFVFCFMICLIGSYIVGRNSAKVSVPVLSASIDDLRAQPTDPEVLNVPRPAETTPPPALTNLRPSTEVTPPAPTQQPKTWTQPEAPKAVVVKDSRRIIGMNYVVMQSYPAEEMAVAARDTLIRNGVDATIEKGVPGLKNDWFSVVGTTGFDKIRGSEFEAYVQRVNEIGDRYYSVNKFYKFGKPLLAIRWRGAGQ